MLSLLALLAVPSLGAAAFPAPARPKPVMYYVKDHRKDLYQVTDPRLLAVTDSVVALFDAPDVSVSGETAALKTTAYSKAYKLCRSEKFYEQRTGPVCSGTLIAPDLVLTAGHCVASRKACHKTKFVFGYALSRPGQEISALPASNVYGCGELLDRQDRENGPDWAVVRLDRPVSGRSPARISWAPPRRGTPLVLAGFPSGLPLKLSTGARVTATGHRGYFEADLDAYAGSSGSGVFLEETGELVGVMVRSQVTRDYLWHGSCKLSRRCTLASCGGQEITRLSEVLVPPALRPGLAQDASARLASFEDSLPWQR